MCDSDKRQAGAEIEVTPEMIEAGAEELWDWILNMGYDETFDMVIARPQAELILRAAMVRGGILP